MYTFVAFLIFKGLEIWGFPTPEVDFLFEVYIEKNTTVLEYA